MAEYRDPDAGLRTARDALLAEVREVLRKVAWVPAARAAVAARLVGSAALFAGSFAVLAIGAGTTASKVCLLVALGVTLALTLAASRRAQGRALGEIARMTRTSDDVAADVERLRALRPAQWAEKGSRRRAGLASALAVPAALLAVGVVCLEIFAAVSRLEPASRDASRFYLVAAGGLLLADAIRTGRRPGQKRDATSVGLRWIGGPMWGAGIASALQGILPEGWAVVVVSYAWMAFGVFLTLWALPRWTPKP